MRSLLLLLWVVGIAGCGIATLSGQERLPAVAALPLPTLPPWIEEISPTGEAATLSQIRIRFQEPLIPIESIDSPDQQKILQKFEILPPLSGQFRFLTPRMVGFQADRAIPQATRVRVTLKAGLADLNKHRLDKDLAWTFSTPPIKLTNLPGQTQDPDSQAEPVGLTPTLSFTANVELDPDSLGQHLRLLPQGSPDVIPVKVALQPSTPAEDSPTTQFDPATQVWNYTLQPQQSLSKAAAYRLEFTPGLLPRHGNLPTTTTVASQIKTYGPLAFEQLQFFGQPDAGGAFGRFVQGGAQLRFNNGLVAASAIAAITVKPAPKNGLTLVQAYDGDTVVNLNPWAFDPGTAYTISIDSQLKDKFGQTLGQPVTVQYTTGDLASDIWAPSGLNIFPSGQNLQLQISAVNLPESAYKAAYRVVQPTDLVYVDTASPNGNGNDLLPNPLTWQRFPLASPSTNQPAEIPVPLREKLGVATGMLAYGVQARTNRYLEDGKEKWRQPDFYGLVQLTNLGVFTQWFPDSGLIRVHQLSDGAAVAGAKVEVYASQLEAKSFPPPQPCAVGQTDPTGTLQFTRQDLASCPAGKNPGEAPNLLTIVRQGDDWAFARSQEYSGAYGYGIDAGWNSGQPESRGTIFSDRQLYQPGETAWFTGTAYYLQHGVLQQDKNAIYQITLEAPDGTKTDLGSQPTNGFGTFSLKLPLKTNQPLGFYTIRGQGSSGAEITGEFRVAEFKPPNFKVDLKLNREFALVGQSVQAAAQSNYLFGPPVEGGQAEYYVTRKEAEFVPPGWESFMFGRRWFWPEERPSLATDVLQVTHSLSQQGQGTQTVTVDPELAYPMTYRVDVQVQDVSNLTVANSQTFTALPSDRLIGLKSDFVADAGKPFSLQVIVTNAAGQVLSGERVRLELQQMEYSNVTQVVEGSETPRNQVKYQTVDRRDVRSESTPQRVTLKPTQSGSYRIRANFVDAKDDRSATDTQIWATGDQPIFWGGRYRNNRLDIQLDKESYKPGDTATALIQSPYPEAELYFAVVRHGTLYRTVQKVKGGAPQIQFQVTPEMLPNAAVEAVLVRQGQPLTEVAPGSLDNLVQIGFTPFKLNLEQKYLKVQATPAQPSWEPGAEATLNLQLQTPQGQPVSGQFTVMVVNEAVLQLTGYRPPDLVTTVYAEQPISTRFTDNRPDVVLEPLASPLEKGWGYGGGFSAGAANTRVRTDFKALAYYNGSLLADSKGEAQVRFKLPDDLTTWRAMVVATDGDLHFGSGDTTFMATQPLVTNPVLPQFARPGDRFQTGVAVTNNSGQTGMLAIQGSVSGSLELTDNNPGTLETPAEAGTHAYRFPVVASKAGASEVKFTTQLNGIADAFAVPLSVPPLEITEQVVETGITTNTLKIPLTIDNQVVADTRGAGAVPCQYPDPRDYGSGTTSLRGAATPLLRTSGQSTGDRHPLTEPLPTVRTNPDGLRSKAAARPSPRSPAKTPTTRWWIYKLAGTRAV
ncbi:alpha-2-macroglobulin family protein [Neosynechococcus sphagnicola]|uniref:alpha-2-macroglobulin family protein n=1 Tax=Neosynechococcus sphagnicola TaxID=1501145 RepID=UPI001EF9FCEF|nr:Ig-like domain-containing alpha-2-macroglobulin family protein [Neosynechococcus sphagnicola]